MTHIHTVYQTVELLQWIHGLQLTLALEVSAQATQQVPSLRPIL